MGGLLLFRLRGDRQGEVLGPRRRQDGLLVNTEQGQKQGKNEGAQDKADHAEIGDAPEDG